MSWQVGGIMLCTFLFVLCVVSILVSEHRKTRDQYSRFDPRVGRDVYRFIKGVHR